MNRVITAAALTLAVWGLARWLDRHYRVHPEPHSPTETWENEGGSVSSPEWTQSSPAPQ